MTTKAQERKALEQIRNIIASLGENSYIGTALEGCLEIAQENIDNDFACSMKQRKEAAEFAEDQLRDKVATLQAQCEAHKKARELAEQATRDEANRANALDAKLQAMKELADNQEQLKVEALAKVENLKDALEAKDEEIIHLKAKLYDMMTK